MTEGEWMVGDLDNMLAHLAKGASHRKLKLFACACCRSLPGYLDSQPDRQALELTERDVDGLATEEEFDQLLEEEFDVRWYRRDAWDAIDRILETYWGETWGNERLYHQSEEEQLQSRNRMNAALALLLLDIFGNPFRPVSTASHWYTWNEGTIIRLAKGIYEERAFDRLPVLADALEEAGCTNADILNHCRSPGPHVRGCWVIDLLLGKD
jgi:hypothetical protein